MPVTLVLEPDNPYDDHAVAVMSAAGQVGHLPRDDARRYGPRHTRWPQNSGRRTFSYSTPRIHPSSRATELDAALNMELSVPARSRLRYSSARKIT